MATPLALGSTEATISEDQLTRSARRLMGTALNAWEDGDLGTAALMAPIAVEHLGKAALWRINPVLLVQLKNGDEASLIQLATSPASPGENLKTIGLRVVLSRLDRLVESLRFAQDRQTRIANIRDGMVHVGASTQARYAVLDCLTIVDSLLEFLVAEREKFYGGSRIATVDGLRAAHRTEVSERVNARISKASRKLREFSDQHGAGPSARVFALLEKERWAEPEHGGHGGVDIKCPACGNLGRVLGELHLRQEMDYTRELLGLDDLDPSVDWHWLVVLQPESFSCSVCKLELLDTEELGEAELPSDSFDVDDLDTLGPHFDMEELGRIVNG